MRTQTSSAVLAAGLVFAAYAPWYGSAQSTTAICQDSYAWMDNEKGQSPCLVAAYLNGQCLSLPTASQVLPLEQIPGLVDYYAPPATGLLAPDDCNCNTVLYSLLAACGTCQNQGFTTWSKWEANCPTVFVSKFPLSIPSAVSVPQWAYLDVTTADEFNISASLALANEHKPDATSSSNSSGSNSSSGSSGRHKKSIVGPVVGGVVGGVAGLAIIALGVWFYLRRRNQRKENTPAHGVVGLVATPSTQGTPDIEKPGYIHSPSPLNAVGGVQQVPELGYVAPEQLYQPQQTSTVLASPTSATASVPMRPYNPDDPSTFPDALLFNNYPTQQQQQASSPSILSSTLTRPLSNIPEVSTVSSGYTGNSALPEVEGTFVPPQIPGQQPPPGGGIMPQSSQAPALAHSGGGGGYQPTQF